MLELHIKETELFCESNDGNGTFKTIKEQTLLLEHSLLSISKWESKWCKPFLSEEQKSMDEINDYIRCMTIQKNVDPLVYSCLISENYDAVTDYISAPMTATWFNDRNGAQNREIITSEVIYYWMIAYNIPFECEKWHLNRLLTLIRVCSIKSQPNKSMSRQAIFNSNRVLNAARRAKMHTKG